VIAILAAVGLGKLLVTHCLAAMADTERAAFFATRSQRADVSVQDWGVSDPGFSPIDSAPGR
jgi:hypothetical protein